jgi:hypothetical protein
MSKGEFCLASVILERVLPLCGPQASRVLALIALELVGHPEQRAVNHGAIIAGQVHETGLDNEAAEFD